MSENIKHFSDLEKDAMKLINIPNWYPWEFITIHNGILCKGAICPLITRGKNKGRPNYRKYDKNTLSYVAIVRT